MLGGGDQRSLPRTCVVCLLCMRICCFVSYLYERMRKVPRSVGISHSATYSATASSASSSTGGGGDDDGEGVWGGEESISTIAVAAIAGDGAVADWGLPPLPCKVWDSKIREEEGVS